MKKTIIMAMMLMLGGSALFAQGFGLRTNVLGWLSCGTINAGVEYQFKQHVSIDLDVYANPFVFGNQRRATHFSSSLAANFFFCEAIQGSYLGIHGRYCNYDAGMNVYNYDGMSIGGGIHYGYLLPLNQHWGMDFTIGVGYTHYEYDLEAREYATGDHEMFGNKTENHWGITRLGVSFLYKF